MIKRLLILLGVVLPVVHSIPSFAGEPMRLTLKDAEKLAVKNNPQLSEAVLKAAAALEVPKEYRAALFPALHGNATGVAADHGSRLAAGGLNNPIVYNRFAAGLSLTQMVTDFGRTWNLVNMAKLRADAQKQATEQTRADVLLLTGDAYFAVLRGEAVLRVARQTVEARQLVADQVTALAESKLKSDLDVSFAKVNLGDAKLLLVQAENALKAASAQLATVLGVQGDTVFSLGEEPMPVPLQEKTDDLVRRALENRPELKGLHLERAAAEKFTRAERALNYPTIGIVGAAGLVPWVPNGQTQLQDHYSAIGVNINIPIFEGGLFMARAAAAALQAKAAQERINDMELKVARDVRVAVLSEQTSCDRVTLTEQMLKQAQTALELAQSRYSLGLSSIVELSQAQLNLTTAQIGFANAKYDCQAQRLNVSYQIGALK